MRVDAIALVAVGRLPQPFGAPGQPLGGRAGQRLRGGLFLQDLGVLKELADVVVGACDVRA
jgi:hypothetical protein